MAEIQSAKHHTRFDPAWHFFVAPVLLLNVLFAAYEAFHAWPLNKARDLWWTVVSTALLVLAGIVRGYSLKVQDRVIRLEERLRLSASMTPSEVAAVGDRQLIALRFASDAEAGALARRAVTEKMDPKAIKAAITDWRPDLNRV